MLDTATLHKINDLRARVLRGDFVDDEELKEALALLGQNRAAAQTAQAEKRTRTKSIAVPSGASILAGMAARLQAKKETP